MSKDKLFLKRNITKIYTFFVRTSTFLRTNKVNELEQVLTQFLYMSAWCMSNSPVLMKLVGANVWCNFHFSTTFPTQPSQLQGNPFSGTEVFSLPVSHLHPTWLQETVVSSRKSNINSRGTHQTTSMTFWMTWSTRLTRLLGSVLRWLCTCQTVNFQCKVQHQVNSQLNHSGCCTKWQDS